MKNSIISTNKYNKFILISVMFILSISLYGCHTIEGVGTDIKQTGKAIEHSAEKNKEPPKCCPYCCRKLNYKKNNLNN